MTRSDSYLRTLISTVSTLIALSERIKARIASLELHSDVGCVEASHHSLLETITLLLPDFFVHEVSFIHRLFLPLRPIRKRERLRENIEVPSYHVNYKRSKRAKRGSANRRARGAIRRDI